MNSRTYSRSETTAMLSELVEKRLESHTSYWAREVSFDRGTPMWRRIDYVGFKPFTPNYAVEPVSVELGVFSCYEVNIAGLGAGDYQMVESKVPDNMTSLITATFNFHITDAGVVSVDGDANKLISDQPTSKNEYTITVKNIDSLTELPQTGGLAGNTMIGVIALTMAGGVAFLTFQSKKRGQRHAL